MPETKKVLGQLSPAAITLSTLYTVPAATQVVGSTLMVCNRGGATTYRVSVAPDGAGDSVEQYLAYDVALGANAPDPIKIGITLDATDVVRVYSASGNVSFQLFGVEVT
jgi:hypothetical protein